MLIINPGSENKGGTYKRAREIAEEWLEKMKKDGMIDIVLLDKYDKEEKGDWTFYYKHKITGKEVALDTHGFTDKEIKEFIFSPRMYWNGSSCSDPEIENWLKEGFIKQQIIIKQNAKTKTKE